jgi:hypothetical protein
MNSMCHKKLAKVTEGTPVVVDFFGWVLYPYAVSVPSFQNAGVPVTPQFQGSLSPFQEMLEHVPHSLV